MQFTRPTAFLRTFALLTALFVGSCFLYPVVSPVVLHAADVQPVSADKERIIKTVRFLSEENFPRSTSPGNKKKTVDYLVNAAAESGLEAVRHEFFIKQILGDDEIAIEINSHTFTNIHVFRKGKTDKRIIVAAHYDALAHSPGADDNASGVAALIELAHFLAKTPELNCDIELVFYDLEEDGLLGSWYHARKLKTGDVDVVGMLCLDMVGYFSDADNSQRYPVRGMSALYGTRGNFLAMIGRSEDTQLLTQVKKTFEDAVPMRIAAMPMSRGLELFLTFSDHAPFWREGYPALLFTDTADLRNRHYHRSSDTWDTLDYNRLAQVPVGIYHVILAIDAAQQ